jgi:integrase
MKLTIANIRPLACPAGRKDRTFFFEGGVQVRVTTKTAGSLEGKIFQTRYPFGKSKRIVRLGPCDTMTPAAAIQAAKAVHGAVALGRDPFAEQAEAKREQAADAYTLDKLVGEWAAHGLATKSRAYRETAPRAIRAVFQKLLDRPATAVERQDVRKLHDALAQRSPQMAARAVAYANAAYSWGIKHDKVAANPFAKLPVAKVNVRARVLSDDELKRIWRATEGATGLGVFNAIVRLLILTGQRRNEIAGLSRSELSSDGATWTLPKERAKNGREHVLPLSVQAQTLIAAQPRSNLTPLVFPGSRGDNVYNGWDLAKRTLDRASGVSNWTLHDLRRTAATGLQRLGVKLEVTEAVLGHVSGSRAGIVGIYQRHTYSSEKRAGLQLWADEVQRIVEGRAEADNVVAMGARRV